MMSLHHAILGILGTRPMSGYDLKKVMQESAFLPWSGNNNQIYKALLELADRGLLTQELHHQEGAPSKKIYTITEAGREALKRWVFSEPEPPEYRKLFLIQLAWSEELNDGELQDLIRRYEEEVDSKLAYYEELIRRGPFRPERSPRESLVWEMIHRNVTDGYKAERTWIRLLKERLFGGMGREGETME